MRARLLIVVSLSASLIVPTTNHAQSAVQSCLVVFEGGTTQRWAGTAAECATRLSPASTYKIPHALIGLETGVVTEKTVEKWDGTKHPNQPKWNLDHTVLSSMRPSVLWFFQRMAPRIGATRARQWLERFDYGNRDTSGDITTYWVNGTLRISPDEQLAFLRQFYDDRLPVSKAHAAAVRVAMDQAPGAVENARGVHKLNAPWPTGASLNSKTGATTLASGESVSWLVGRLMVDTRPIVFASAVWRAKGGVDTLDATTAAVRTLIARGVLHQNN